MTGRRPIFSTLWALILVGVNGNAAAGLLEELKDLVPGDGQDPQSLSSTDIGSGLKEALRVGTENVVTVLGTTDGFNLDPQIHIPLPEKLGRVTEVLARIGMESMLTDLELRLNRAAEVATPRARQLFVTAITDMTLGDVMQIYNGPPDSATRYFQSKMSPPLAMAMRPVVDESLADVGAARSYEAAMLRYNSVPFVRKVDTDLSAYVVQKAMDGIFYYLAKEEAAIRENPAKRTSELLRRVFGR